MSGKTNLPAQELPLSRMVTNAIGLSSVAFYWAVESAFGTPLLLSLGMSKANSSLVWLAGPFTGLFYPFLGAFSDRCKSRLGRRRPFILGGAAMAVTSLMLLAYAREIGSIWSADGDTTADIGIAVFAFVLMEVSSSFLQLGSRSLVTDVTPKHQHKKATGVISIMMSTTELLGFLLGCLDLPSWFGLEGEGAQVKIMCWTCIAVVTLFVSITCLTIRETPLSPTLAAATAPTSVLTVLTDLLHVARNLPKQVQYLCWISFCAWFAWYPLCFYTTTWVAQYYTGSHHPFAHGENEDAQRHASIAVEGRQVLALLAVVITPMLYSRFRHRVSFSRVWTVALLLLALTMWGSIFVWGYVEATVLLIVAGIPWGLGGWVPYAMLSEQVTHLRDDDEDENKPVGDADSREEVVSPTKPGYSSKDVAKDITLQQALIQDPESAPDSTSTLTETSTSTSKSPRSPHGISAGKILGFFYLFSVFAQFIASFVSRFIFHLLDPALASHADPSLHAQDVEPEGIVPGDSKDAIGWLMRLGGTTTFIAVLISLKLRDVRKGGSYQKLEGETEMAEVSRSQPRA